MAGLSELHEARALAHRLSSECKESPYRPLVTQLRALRNLLEDIEDSFEDAAATLAFQGYVLERIIHTKLVLAQLSLALQQTTNAPEDRTAVSTSLAPGVFGGLIDDTTAKLSTARDALLTPEPPPVSPRQPGPISPVLNVAAPVLEHVTPQLDQHYPLDSSLRPSRWSDIYLDPLSAPIEQATSIILSEDPDPKPRARGMSMRSERDSALPPPVISVEGSKAPHISHTEASSQYGNAHDQPRLDRAAEAPELSNFPAMDAKTETKEATSIISPPPIPSKAVIDEVPPARDFNSKELPPLPRRRSPLPPRTNSDSPPVSAAPSVESVKRPEVRSSRYRIVNPDPSQDVDSPEKPTPETTLDMPSPPLKTPEIVIDASALRQDVTPQSETSLPLVLVTEHRDEPIPANPPTGLGDATVIPADVFSPSSVISSTTQDRNSVDRSPAVIDHIETLTKVDRSESSLELDTRTHRSSSMPSQAQGTTPPSLYLSKDANSKLTSAPTRRNRSQSDLNASTSQPRVSVDSLNRPSPDAQLPQRPRTQIYNIQRTPSPVQPWNVIGKDTDPAVQIAQDVTSHRVHQIVDTWNRCLWDAAETYLTGHLSNLMDSGERLAERRTRHLLGVCASFQGQSSKAISYFLSVLRCPVLEVDDLDVGDCAAAYWLADEYALLNRRSEALLAYSIAERSPLYQDRYNARLSQCIWAERRNCLRGVGRSDFQQYFVTDDVAAVAPGQPGASLLESATIGPAARALLDVDFRQRPNAFVPTFELDPSKPRAATLSSLHTLVQGVSPARYYGIRITAEMLYPDSYWPMAYDPFYCASNVARGRLLLNESDMLQVFTTIPDAKVPRSGPLDASRKDCFHCSDLTWLINAIRNTLLMFGMEWSEVANVEGSWFVVRYVFVEHNVRVATTHYFTISLFRPSFRSGYGCEICPDGSMSASRIINADPNFQKGVHIAEPKRLRKLIRESLEEQAKQRPKSRRQSGVMLTMGSPELPGRYA